MIGCACQGPLEEQDTGGVFLLLFFDLFVAFNVTDHDILLNSYGDVGTVLYFLSQ